MIKQVSVLLAQKEGTKNTASATGYVCAMWRAAVTACGRPILLLLPHEPLLLIPGNAAFALASALVLDACKGGTTRGLVGFSACLPKGVLPTLHSVARV